MTVALHRAVDDAAAVLGALAERDVPLGPATTYGIGGSAALFVRPRSITDLATVAAARHTSGLPVLVVGRGSNMLIADDGYVGIVVSLTDLAADIDLGDAPPADTGDETGGMLAGDGRPVVVTAGGAVSLPVLARRTAAAGIKGFEWAVGIPGSIGGAVTMNAGGHGSDMSEVLIDATVVRLDDDEPRPLVVPCDELGLRFRGSDLRPLDVVLSARLALATGDSVQAGERVREVVRWRLEHQPGGRNCGSVFVNPVPGEVSAGALIDDLGLRGFRVGTASVSTKHANFIQADDKDAKAADVRALMEHIRARVADETGHRLRSEVRLIGFDDVDVSLGGTTEHSIDEVAR